VKDPTGLLIIFGLPLLAVTLVVSYAVWSASRKRRRFERFAAAEGITFQLGPSPIPLPNVVYEKYRRSLIHNDNP